MFPSYDNFSYSVSQLTKLLDNDEKDRISLLFLIDDYRLPITIIDNNLLPISYHYNLLDNDETHAPRKLHNKRWERFLVPLSVYTYMCMYVYVCICVYTYTYVCVYIYIYIHT